MVNPTPADVAIVALIGFLTTAALAPLAVRAARRLGMLDHPGGYKAHAAPTPLLGGLAVVGGAATGVFWALASDAPMDAAGLSAVAVGLLVVTAAGLFDDLHGLSPARKILWQAAATLAAGICLAALGVRLELFLSWPDAAVVALTAIWIVTITNAVNFLDNMNGLCAGIGAVAGAFLALCNLRSGELTAALAAAALSGACLGFVPFNWPRARVFLGDAGSMAIGFALASLSVLGVYTPGAQLPVLAVFTPLLVLAVPLLDLLLVVVLRLTLRHPPWLGDRRHISHRLVRRGMRPAAAVATLWSASAACGFAALLLPTVGVVEAPLLLGAVACALGALAAAAGWQGLA